MAKAIGARVITTAGSAEKVERCRELGADLAINYKTDDVDARIKEFAPKGVNVWWETLREPNFDRAVRLLAARGRMVIMAGREARPPFPVGPFYVKGCSLFGFAMFNATRRRTAGRGRRHQPLAGRRQAEGEHRPRAAAGEGRRGPSPARRKHDRQSRHAGRQDRAEAVAVGERGKRFDSRGE